MFQIGWKLHKLTREVKGWVVRLTPLATRRGGGNQTNNFLNIDLADAIMQKHTLTCGNGQSK